jgi:hypothetical protein
VEAPVAGAGVAGERVCARKKHVWLKLWWVVGVSVHAAFVCWVKGFDLL